MGLCLYIGGIKFANKCLAGKSYSSQACLKVSLNLSTVLSIIITSNHIDNNPSYFFVQLVLCPAFRLSNPISYECDVKTALLWRMLKVPPRISLYLHFSVFHESLFLGFLKEDLFYFSLNNFFQDF